MIRLFIRAVWGKIAQGTTDAKGMFLRPRATLEEIAERKDWGIPAVLLGVVALLGLPFLPAYVGSGETLLLPGFLRFPLFAAIVILWMRLASGKWRVGSFLRLSAYLVIPYLLLWAVIFALGIVGWIVLTLSKPAVLSLTAASFAHRATVVSFCLLVPPSVLCIAWTVWLTYLTLRTLYRPVSRARCLACIIAVIVVANVGSSALGRAVENSGLTDKNKTTRILDMRFGESQVWFSVGSGTTNREAEIK